MPGQKTDPKIAAQAVVMSRSGYGTSAISRLLETPLGTIKDIVSGRNGWDRIHEKTWFQEYCATYTVVLRASLTEIAKKAFIRVDETVGEATPGQAMWIGAVAVDKIEKLDGRTMGIPDEPLTKEKYEGLESTRIMLLKEIERRILVAEAKEAAIVVEAEKVSEGNGNPETP